MLMSEKTVLLIGRNIFILRYSVSESLIFLFFFSHLWFRYLEGNNISNTEIGFYWPHLCDEAALLIYIKANVVYSVT